MNIKQVIVMRTKYPDGKGGTTGLRKGKMIAQASHASLSFISRSLRPYSKNSNLLVGHFEKPAREWLNGSFAKVCCYVETEEELLDIYNKAREADLEVHLITDSGKTEFGGKPTKTCLAIGPDYESRIDEITGHLPLL